MGGDDYEFSQTTGDKMPDPKYITPYGDSMNDGKVQISFTLPVADNEKGIEAAKELSRKMGVSDPNVTCHKALDDSFTFYIVYGSVSHRINYGDIKVLAVTEKTMDMQEIDEYISQKIGRKIVILGASTGTDAHTVGIDAIMNMKGFAGHYGLERYKMIEAHNMGSQVQNEEFIAKAVALNADALLVSQTVTQKDIHIQNLTNLIELLEAEGLRSRFIVCCGGARIGHELAKELGFDAGFGSGKFAEDVATFVATELYRRSLY